MSKENTPDIILHPINHDEFRIPNPFENEVRQYIYYAKPLDLTADFKSSAPPFEPTITKAEYKLMGKHIPTGLPYYEEQL